MVSEATQAADLKILVIDDDPLVMVVVRRALEGMPHRLFSAPDGASGVNEVESVRPDVVILDNVLPDGLGLDWLGRIHEIAANTPVLFVTARGSGSAAIEAMKQCAFDYLPKPLDPQKLRATLNRAVSLKRVLERQRSLSRLTDTAPSPSGGEREGPVSLVGDCPAMQLVFKAIGKVALQDIAVLIRGEHGTGKEAVAREIHSHSGRKDGPLVKLHCRGLDEQRLERELFGEAERSDNPCRIELAAGGTLVLQEVGGLSLPLQSKLLRAVRDGYFERAGGFSEPRPVECRIIAITTEDLENKARAGAFRSDLFYALSSFTISMPPVRQRHGDLRLLVENGLRKLRPVASAFGVSEPQVSDEAMSALGSHLWPGNIDELESVLKRALIEQNGNILLPHDLIEAVAGESAVPSTPRASRYATDWGRFAELRIEAGGDTLHSDAIEETERKLFARVLRHTRGNQAQAARILGITRASLRKKLRLYGMVAKQQDE